LVQKKFELLKIVFGRQFSPKNSSKKKVFHNSDGGRKREGKCKENGATYFSSKPT
jgi:hypothetical protein